MTTDTTTTDPIIVELNPANVAGTRVPCTVCHGHTEKFEVPAEFTDDEGSLRTVCVACLDAGADWVPGLLQQKAHDLEAWARDLRELAERDWVLPSREDWDRADAAVARDLRGPDGLPF